MSTVENLSVTMDQAYPLVMDILRPRLVPNLLSSPGVGKSALARLVALRNNLCIIDCRLSSADPNDLNGFPFIITEDRSVLAKIKAGYVPMETFPIESDELPKKYNRKKNPETGEIEYIWTGERYKGWLLLLDEFNSAPLAVQAAAYKLVLDKMVGMHKLHPHVAVMAAGNLSTDKAIVNRLSTAMQSRLIHLQIRCCPVAWRKWADKHNIDHRVKSFLQFKPNLLHNFNPNHNELTFPCPRTWEFMSQIIKPWDTITMPKIPLMGGTVGDGAAQEFYSYTEIFNDIPTIEEILNNPTGCSFGDEPSMHYALSGLVANHITVDNADQLIPFIRRLEIDFQAITMKTANRKDRAIKRTKEGIKWIADNAAELM